MNRRQFIFSAASGGLIAGFPAALHARSYPSRPIRLIVPFAKGGTTDITARIVADPLAKALGQPVSVDNIVGAGGTRGTRALAIASNDGYTLGMGTVSTTGIGPIVRNRISYDPLIDFTPVIQLVDFPGVVCVHPEFPADDFAGFIRQVRKHPGRFSYASSGPGSIQHMGMELFKLRNRLFLVHIPYRDASLALNDVIAGRTHIIWGNLNASLPHINAGRLRPIGLISNQRSRQIPELSTFEELGVTGYRDATYVSVLAPTATPTAIIDSLNATLNRVLIDSQVAGKLQEAGSIPFGGSPAELRQRMITELRKWGAVARYAKVRV